MSWAQLIVAVALAANPDAAQRIREGQHEGDRSDRGHGDARETKGRADGGEVTRLVNEQLGV